MLRNTVIPEEPMFKPEYPPQGSSFLSMCIGYDNEDSFFFVAIIASCGINIFVLFALYVMYSYMLDLHKFGV